MLARRSESSFRLVVPLVYLSLLLPACARRIDQSFIPNQGTANRSVSSLAEASSLSDVPQVRPSDYFHPNLCYDLAQREGTLDVSRAISDSGSNFIVAQIFAIPGDSVDDSYRSQLTLYENGVALGPSHSLHADIRAKGSGRFSHWGNSVYFSSSDNSDPRTNGRRYTFKIGSDCPADEGAVELSRIGEVAGFRYFIPQKFAVAGDSAEAPFRSTLILYENGVELGPAHSRVDLVQRVGKGAYSHWGDTINFSSSDNTNPLSNGRSYTYRVVRGPFPKRGVIDASRAVKDQGNNFIAVRKFPVPGDDSKFPARSTLRLYEDGFELGPPHSMHKLIRAIGRGAYSHWGDSLYFSSSDNTDPRTNGRRYTYEITAEPQGEEGLIQLLAFAGQDGFRYIFQQSFPVPGDTNEAPRRSVLKVFENGTELGPAHSLHADIRSSGQGRFSHWGDSIYLSASDNTDPRTNGRKYTWRIVPDPLVDGALVDVTGGLAPQGFNYIFPQAFPYPLPGDTATLSRQSRARIYENRLQIERISPEIGPAHSIHEDIRRLGLGRFSHWGDSLYLSASNNTDPRTNGRVYTYRSGAVPYLVRDNEPIGAIVVLAQDSPEMMKAELWAAQEIQHYIHKVTGAALTIRSDIPDAGAAIVIGENAASAPAKRWLSQRSKRREAFAFLPGTLFSDRETKTLFLVGNGPSALVYAGQQFLESYVGVRFVFPGPDGTFLPPSRALIKLPQETRVFAPAWDLRGPSLVMSDPPEAASPSLNAERFSDPDISASRLFSIRLRLNGNASVPFAPGDTWIGLGSGHSYYYYLPPTRYRASHPDWYTAAGQLNTVSTAAAREFALQAKGELDGAIASGATPGRIRLFVSPNDFAPLGCDLPAQTPGFERNQCNALLAMPGGASNLVVNFANLVAREIHADPSYAAVKIVFYVYADYSQPSAVKPERGVTPELTFWGSVGANHAKPMLRPGTPGNDSFGATFRAWATQSDEVSLYQYYTHYLHFTPFPVITQMAYDFAELVRDPKYYGMWPEHHLNYATQFATIYAHAKLSWDPQLNVAELLDDFFSASFGLAGRPLLECQRILQESMDRLPFVGGERSEIPFILSAEVSEKCDRLYARAQGLDNSWRTQLALQGWSTSRRTADALRTASSAASSQSDLPAILSNLDYAMKSSDDSRLGRWGFDHTGFAVPPGSSEAIRQASDGTVRYTLWPTYRSLSVPVSALPPGSGSFLDDLNYGGILRFFPVRFEGFKSFGMYGYELPNGSVMSLTFPLRAQPGHVFKRAKITVWTHPCAALTLRADSVEVSNGTDLTLDRASLTYVIQLSNQCPGRVTALDQLQLDWTVE